MHTRVLTQSTDGVLVFSLPFGHIFMKHDVGRFGWDAECTGSHAHICWEFLCAARGHCANLCSSDFWPVFSYQFSSCFRFWESKFSVCVGTRWRCYTFFSFRNMLFLCVYHATNYFYVYIMWRTTCLFLSVFHVFFFVRTRHSNCIANEVREAPAVAGTTTE